MLIIYKHTDSEIKVKKKMKVLKNFFERN